MYAQKYNRGLALFSIILAIGLLMGCNLPISPAPTQKSPPITNNTKPVTEAATVTNTASPSQKKPKQTAQPIVATVAPSPTLEKITFSVGPDQSLVYPTSLGIVADEHTILMPPAAGSELYLIFAASIHTAKGGGPVALETKYLKTFTFATGYSSPVMWSPYAPHQLQAFL